MLIQKEEAQLFPLFRSALLASIVLFLIQLAVMITGLLAGFDGSKPLEAVGPSLGLDRSRSRAPPLVLSVMANIVIAWLAALLALEISLLLRRGSERRQLVFLVVLLLWGTILWENTRLFPGSAFALRMNPPELFKVFSAWYAWVGAMAAVAVWRVLQAHRMSIGSTILLLPLFFLFLCYLFVGVDVPGRQVTSSHRPNIIFIGIDSLRTDVVAGVGGKTDFVPNMSRFLAE